MQNKELMDKLLWDNMEQALAAQRQAATKQSNLHISDTDKNSNTDWTNMAEIRIVTAKYKVYIVLLLIWFAIFGLNLIPAAKDSFESKKSTYDSKKSELNNIISDIKLAEQDTQFLQEIKDNESNIIGCLDKWSNCNSLPNSWNKDLSVPVSYLQASSLHSFKMAVDEKKVLKNLDTYLIRKEIWASNTRVWDITRIVIWDPKEINNSKNHFFEVPVSVTIEFENIAWLTWFLYNIEKKIIENSEDRILYKIQSVSYDILASDEPQVADISMLAYYYYDERFENMETEQNSSTWATEKINSEEEIQKEVSTEKENVSGWIWDKVGSFFKNFFSK